MKRIFKIALVSIMVISLFTLTACGNSNSKKISVLIIGKDSKELYSKKVKTGKETMYEVLKNLDVKAVFKESDSGSYIISLMNLEEKSDEHGSYYWTYFVDDKSSSESISNLKVEDGKTYKFVYDYYSY